jgi:hypothetical protein
MKDAVMRNLDLIEENLRLKADVKRFAEINDSLIEDNERLQEKLKEVLAERNQLIEELTDERDRHDRLQDFEVAEAKELTDAKRIAEDWKNRFKIAVTVLALKDYDVEDLIQTVSQIRAELLREEHHE